MTEPICQDLQAGGPGSNWEDVPCGDPATTTFDGRPVCQGHYETAERREIEAIAEHFFDGVPLEELRRIATAGGLKFMLAEVERLKAFPVALERTERGLTKPCRLGSLAALLSELLCGRYAETAASPKAMQRILRDVADIYRGLVQAGGHDASGYFPSLPPLSSEEAEMLWAECLEEARSQS